MRPSFRDIFEAYYEYLWVSLARLGVRDSDQEDMVNEVLLRVHGRLSEYDPSRPIKPWLFAFAFRVASDYRRLARNREEVSADGDVVPYDFGAATPESLVGKRELVRKALNALSLEHRAVLILCDIDETPMKVVAENLEIPLFTAYSRLRLARARFAAAVRELAELPRSVARVQP